MNQPRNIEDSLYLPWLHVTKIMQQIKQFKRAFVIEEFSVGEIEEVTHFNLKSFNQPLDHCKGGTTLPALYTAYRLIADIRFFSKLSLR